MTSSNGFQSEVVRWKTKFFPLIVAHLCWQKMALVKLAWSWLGNQNCTTDLSANLHRCRMEPGTSVLAKYMKLYHVTLSDPISPLEVSAQFVKELTNNLEYAQGFPHIWYWWKQGTIYVKYFAVKIKIWNTATLSAKYQWPDSLMRVRYFHWAEKLLSVFVCHACYHIWQWDGHWTVMVTVSYQWYS